MSVSPLRVVVGFFAALVVTSDCIGAGESVITAGKKSLPLPGESFKLDGHDAFLILPPGSGDRAEVPWVWYAPTLSGLPAKSEVWMFERILARGIAIAGIDVGESYGSPDGCDLYSAFYDFVVEKRSFGKKPVLLARSRGGLMLYSWATKNPQSVGGVAGIYPVCSIASYPGVERAAGAYGMTAEDLQAKLSEHNPIDRLESLAKAKVPVLHIHGDQDRVVPLEANSAELGRRYKSFGGPVEIEVIPGQGHNMWTGWFQSQKLTDFIIARALGEPPGADDPPGGADPAKPESGADAAPDKLSLPGLEINLAERCVDVESRVCLREGTLELIACAMGSKDHESIVEVKAKAMHIHTALLLLGAEPGSPALRKSVGDGEEHWIDVPPHGGAVDVFLFFKNGEGKEMERSIDQFIKPVEDSGATAKFPTHTFLFAGSHLVGKGEGPRHYLADRSGNVISIATFGDEMLCLPGVHARDNGALLWEVDPSHLPAVGSAVTLRLRPSLPPNGKSPRE